MRKADKFISMLDIIRARTKFLEKRRYLSPKRRNFWEIADIFKSALHISEEKPIYCKSLPITCAESRFIAKVRRYTCVESRFIAKIRR